MRRALALALFILVVFCPHALGDQLILKNGDKLTGKIVKSDTKSILIKTEYAGDVTISWDVVEQITSDAPLYLTLADGRTVSGLLSTSGDQIEIRTGTSSVVTSKAAIQSLRSEGEQAAIQRLEHPGWFDLWSGSANLGLALTSGNSETTNAAFGLGLTRATSRDKTTIYGAAVYARDSTEEEEPRTTANAIRGGVRYDRDISRRWFGYGFTDLESNQLQDLNLRFVLGGGLGFHAIRSERTQLDLLAGLDWAKEYFDGEENDRSSAEAQLGQTLSYQLNSRAALKEQFFVFPNLSEGGEYRMNFDTSLVIGVTRWIGWQLTVSDRYLSNPPPDLKKNDLLLTTGLSFKIGGPAN